MELERAGAQLGKIEALDRPVVERDVRRLFRVGRADREAVILARDENAAAVALEHRMVRAAVTEGQLERLVAGRHGQDLVAQTDAEHIYAAEQVAHDGRLLLERLRV